MEDEQGLLTGEASAIQQHSSRKVAAALGLLLAGAAVLSSKNPTSLATKNEVLFESTVAAQRKNTIYNSFNKWTLTSGSPELAKENSYAMWWGVNMRFMHRYPEETTFMEVGPTGCDVSGNTIVDGADGEGGTETVSVLREWISTPYTGDDAGGNEIHWVYDQSANNEASELTVKAWHEALKTAHGDLTGEPNQFMDDRHTYYTAHLDDFIEETEQMAYKFDLPRKLRMGRSDRGTIFLIEFCNNEGQIFEILSDTLLDSKLEAAFEPDDCLFRPLAGFKAFDAKLEKFDFNLGGDDYDTKDDTVYGDDGSRRNLRTTGAEKTKSAKKAAQAKKVAKEATKVVASEDDYSDDDPEWSSSSSYVFMTDSRQRYQVATMPSHTSIATSDPNTDGDYMVRYLGATDEGDAYDSFISDVTHIEREALEVATDIFSATSPEQCNVDSKWLLLNSTVSDQPHYVRLAYHSEARPVTLSKNGKSMDLKQWEEYLGELRADLGNNVYDVFMDDHLGITVHAASFTDASNFAAIGMKLWQDGEPILTRREPQPGTPTIYQTNGYEKFSMFIRLPTSKFALQLILSTSSMSALEMYGLPTEFCDWSFCDFANYRSKTLARLTNSTECGFKMTSWLENIDDAYVGQQRKQ